MESSYRNDIWINFEGRKTYNKRRLRNSVQQILALKLKNLEVSTFNWLDAGKHGNVM